MRHQALVARVEHREVTRAAGPRCSSPPVPRPRSPARDRPGPSSAGRPTGSAGSRRNRAARPKPGRRYRPRPRRSGWPGRYGARCDAHRDRADTGAATAVRDAERLVQVQVRHVGAEPARLRETEQRVEVRAVDVDLAAARRGPGRTARRSPVSYTPCVDGYVTMIAASWAACCVDLALQVVEVDVAVLVARDHDDAHARHHGAGRVRAVRARRDQADVAAVVTVARWYARIASSPASSPCEPAFGWTLTASYPVTSASQLSSCAISSR